MPDPNKDNIDLENLIDTILTDLGGHASVGRLCVELTKRSNKLIYASSIYPALQRMSDKIGILTHLCRGKNGTEKRELIYQIGEIPT